MRKTMLLALAVAVLLLALLGGWQAHAIGATTGTGAETVPAISFIQNPTATCYRPEIETDVCYVNWSSVSVSTADPAYIITMTVEIDGRLVAYHGGFFQRTMTAPWTLTEPGFRVPCGAVDPTNPEGLGPLHPYVIRARDTAGKETANYGSVRCPAGTFHFYMPVAVRAS